MNREILFRGKRRDAPHQWIYGDLNHIDDKVYIFDRDPNGDLNSPDWYEVDPETVGQFTGLLDKEGNKIFEGDIMEIPDYSRGIFIIGKQPKKLKVCEWSDGFHGASFKDVQVLGNIFDHPHLLNKTSNQQQ